MAGAIALSGLEFSGIHLRGDHLSGIPTRRGPEASHGDFISFSNYLFFFDYQ